MNVILYTFDLYRGHEYLMPWRTLWEVAKIMQSYGHNVCILSAQSEKKYIEDYVWQGVHIKSVENNTDMVMEYCLTHTTDAIFVPLTFRDGIKRPNWLKSITCRKIAYMAGGVYDVKSALFLAKSSGLTWAKPYLWDSITPGRIFQGMLNDVGFEHVIGLTACTTGIVKKNGFRNVTTIYPGKDAFDKIPSDESLLQKYGLTNKRWLLFSGAPAATRGALQLVQAVDKVNGGDLRLVMLIRTDIGSRFETLESVIQNMRHPERIHIINEPVTREQLRAFFGNAWYALLPFIVIPSEVPLTYFELLSCGTPVITFENGGTTEYLKDGLLIADKSVSGLAKALDLAWSNTELRDTLSANGKRIMAAHPTWEQVGHEWTKLLEKQ